jgi:4-diphosphocytidyl-2-C-methyl-D-erythritol kinase
MFFFEKKNQKTFDYGSRLCGECAPAKVNLTLLVTGRRGDGYHLLDSFVVFAGAHDELAAAPCDQLTLRLTGPFAAGLSDDADNLVLRAARALRDAAGSSAGAALTLTKNLPVASGIGGGSSDAAAALRLLARLWGVAPARGELAAIAAGLGADVPVCLDPAPCRMSGIGEVLGEAPAVPPCGMVLINPGVPVATQRVFAAREGAFSAPAALPAGWADAAEMAAGLAEAGNDLQAPAMRLCPAIGEVLAALRGVDSCLLARMSGSGATCFGLFESEALAAQAAARLARPGWWCWGGGLYGAPAGT